MSLKRLRRRIAGIVDWVDGIMGVAIHVIETGEEIGVSADEPFPMASVCKTPILVEAYRQAEEGRISLDSRREITPALRTPGSGLLNFCDEGLNPTLRDLLLLMIVVSDNAATDMVLSVLGGPAVVTATMKQLGLEHIRLDRTIRELLNDISTAIDPRAGNLDYAELEALFETQPELKTLFQDKTAVRAAIQKTTTGRDCATPREIARLYAQIASSQCASPEACRQILKTLERQQLRTRLPREFPPHIRFCHKTGTLGPGTVCNDSGLLFLDDRAIAIAVLSKEMAQEPAATNTAIARIGRAVYDHFA